MPLDAAARVEIHELYARYALCFDDGDAVGYAAVFTGDGRFVRPGEPDVVGTEALEAFVREREAATPGITHHTTNVSVEETPDGVRGRAYVIVLRTSPGEPLRLRNLGAYADELVLADRAWRFRSRTFTSWLAPGELDRPLAFSA